MKSHEKTAAELERGSAGQFDPESGWPFTVPGSRGTGEGVPVPSQLPGHPDGSTRPGIGPVQALQSKGAAPDSCSDTLGRTRDELSSKSNGHLLDAIRAAKERVGEGLNDHELTRLLLLDTELPTEAGFTFLSFSGGVVTLSVPKQDLKNWYPEQGWIAPAKEKVARALAEKYGLSLYEPVDTTTSFLHPPSDPEIARHHIELNDRWQAVIVAHPHYLKVRLLGKSPHHRYGWEALTPLALGPEILQDVSSLYHQI